MAKEEKIVLDAVVTEALPDTRFMVELENGQKILAYISGRMRKFYIRILPGDTVKVEISPTKVSDFVSATAGVKPDANKSIKL